MTRKEQIAHERSWDRPLLFWREQDGRRMGLACLASFCGNPDCTCQEAELQAFEVDERFQKISVDGEKVHLLAEKRGGPPPKGRLTVVVDLETGRLVRTEGARPRRRAAELQRWLEEALDPTALEELRSRWRLFKEQRRREAARETARTWRDQDWTEWDGEAPVGWYEVHPETAEDRYRLNGATYEALDRYCIRPGCDCQDALVSFHRVVDDEIGEMIGEVFVEAESGEVVGTNNAPGEHRVLIYLWSLYEASHDLSELDRRHREMRRLGPQIHALREKQLHPPPVRQGAKVGRNEPCPCGSGQKYKKCCSRSA